MALTSPIVFCVCLDHLPLSVQDLPFPSPFRCGQVICSSIPLVYVWGTDCLLVSWACYPTVVTGTSHFTVRSVRVLRVANSVLYHLVSLSLSHTHTHTHLASYSSLHLADATLVKRTFFAVSPHVQAFPPTLRPIYYQFFLSGISTYVSRLYKTWSEHSL